MNAAPATNYRASYFGLVGENGPRLVLCTLEGPRGDMHLVEQVPVDATYKSWAEAKADIATRNQAPKMVEIDRPRPRLSFDQASA